MHLPLEQVTPDSLRDAVSAVEGSPDVAARLAEHRAALRAAGGAAAAADVAEALLDREDAPCAN
ncbi:hypothetical protein [Saccharomonospora iraqiensis]|uniref:hypothetical protein n=1 Tax=Saccharomonospora iraqiensis TaxID=52698 RepID=UPI00022E2B95|nr:hypothetical protein [Saccharomonospora iraqiensis]